MDPEIEASAGGFEEQEDYSAAEESAQDETSENSDDTSQELASLRDELAEAKRAIDEAKSQIGTLQATKDREVRAAEARYQALIARISADRSREERQQLIQRAIRAKDDPDEAEALATDLLTRLQRSEEAEGFEQKLREVDARSRQTMYEAVYRDESLGLTAEERKEAEKRAMEEPSGLTIPGFVKHATAIKEAKVSEPMKALQAEIAAMREEVKALKGQNVGNALREAGGPEKPPSGGGNGNGASYADRLRRGEDLLPDEIDAIVAKRFTS